MAPAAQQDLSAEQRLEQLEYALGMGDYAPQPGDSTKDPSELLAGFRRQRRDIEARLAEELGDDERVRLEHQLRVAIAGVMANATSDQPEIELRALQVEREIAQGQIARANKPDDPRFVGDFVSNAERARRTSERLPEIDAAISQAERRYDRVMAAA